MAPIRRIFQRVGCMQGLLSSEVSMVAQEVSSRIARASLDGVTTRSTASILNATRYHPLLSSAAGHFTTLLQGANCY